MPSSSWSPLTTSGARMYLAWLSFMLSFVVPIYNERAVGVTMFSSVAWFLYAAPDYPAAVYSMGVNTTSTVLQLVYVAVFLRFAAGVGRRHALYAFAPILTASMIMTVLVFTKVIWGSQFVAYVAAIAAFSAYCSVAIDVVVAMRSRDVNNMDPLVEVLLGLVNASASTISGFFSTPPDFLVVIPNVIGVPVLLAQLVVYVMHCNPQPEPNPPPPEQERGPIHTVDVPNYAADLHTLFACQV